MGQTSDSRDYRPTAVSGRPRRARDGAHARGIKRRMGIDWKGRLPAESNGMQAPGVVFLPRTKARFLAAGR